jgi:CHRD domain
MKRKSLPLFLTTLLALSLIFNACSTKDPDKSDTVDVFADINSRNIIGVASGSSATGTFSGTYNKSTKTLAYSIAYTGLTPSEAFIAVGAFGVEGAKERILPLPTANPITGSLTLNAQQENNLFFQSNSISLATTKFPRGEIRGNIVIKPYGPAGK